MVVTRRREWGGRKPVFISSKAGNTEASGCRFLKDFRVTKPEGRKRENAIT